MLVLLMAVEVSTEGASGLGLTRKQVVLPDYNKQRYTMTETSRFFCL